jgi:hypothetical protein
MLNKNMKLVKIGHCGGYEMSKKDVLSIITTNDKLVKKIKDSGGSKFLVLQGNTRIAGYLWVIQCICNKYLKSDVVAVSENMSVYAIG